MTAVHTAVAVLPGTFVVLVRNYIDLALAQLDIIRTAVAASDPEMLMEAARILRGASALVGAAQLAACCQLLEAAGRAGMIDAAEGLLQGMVQALGRAQHALVAVCATADTDLAG